MQAMWRLLSKDPYITRDAARLLLTHLVQLRGDQGTRFEKALLDDDVLMRQIDMIAHDEAPDCIWRKRGRTSYLFRFLAARFVGAPDSVGGCESIHAQWKWVETNRRHLTLKMLNSFCRLRNYVRSFGALPDYEDLRDHFDTLESYYNMLYQGIREGGEVSSRAVTDYPYRERFNVRGADLKLIAVDDSSSDDEPHNDIKDVDVAWGNYVRFLFAAHNIYCLTAIRPNTLIYIAENKSVAYREERREGESIGRAISIIWLEADTSEIRETLEAGEVMFSPPSGADGTLDVQNISVAELSLAAGYYPPNVTGDHSDRDIELMHERHFLQNNVERYKSRRASVTDGTAWRFVVDMESGVDIEYWNYETRDLGDHTKMSLARQLQERDQLSDDQRNKLWSQKKATLLTALNAGHGGAAPVAAAAAAPAAKAKGAVKGKGKGRAGVGRGGKAKAKGKGVVAKGKGLGKGAKGKGRG